MQDFKRNQVDEAIARYFDQSEPDNELRSRAKRLLDIDRKLPPPKHTNLRRAFYSDEGPGSGNEVLFSEYEAFALLLGLRLLNHHWRQQTVVELLRDARHDLEHVHFEIMSEDPKVIFNKEQALKLWQANNYAGDNTRPTFLLIVSDSDSPRQEASSNLQALVFRNPIDAFNFTLKKAGRSSTWLELVTPAHKFNEALANTQPSKRGRS